MVYKVKVPVGKNKDDGSSTTKQDNKQLGKEIKGLTTAVAVGNVLASAAQSVMSGLSEILSPIGRILSALLVAVFIPLLPLLQRLTSALGKFTADVAEAGGGFKGIIEALKKNLDFEELLGLGAIIAGLILIAFTTSLAGIGWAALLLGAVIMFGDELAQGIITAMGDFWSGVLSVILIAAGAIILLAIGGWALALAGILVAGLIAFWDTISSAFSAFWEDLKQSWAIIVENFKTLFIDMPLKILGLFLDFLDRIWDNIKDVGKWIAEAVRKALASTVSSSNVGGSVWNIAKGIGRAINPFDDFIQRPGQAPTAFSPSDTVIGVKDTSSLGGSTTININNPTVRSDADIRKLTDAISRELQRRSNRGFSSI